MPQIPATMTALVLNGHGGFDQLELRHDVPVPAPASGEVLIRVAAAGVNNTDINTRIGWYSKTVEGGTDPDDAAKGSMDAASDDATWGGTALRFPHIQGADVCGYIADVGAGVAESRIGERVIVEPCWPIVFADGTADVCYLGSECPGGFAQYVAVPAANAKQINAGLSDVELASFPCSYSTAMNLVTRSGVAPGETVLVTGASGGVGSAAVQIAKAVGARIIAVASSSKAEAISALGADQVVDRSASLGEVVAAGSVDVVIDVVGGDGFPNLLDCLKPRGRYATSGAIAGPLVELDLRTLYLKDLSLIGCTVLDDGVFDRLVELINDGTIRPLVAKTYPLAQIIQAQQDFLQKTHVGKLVLEIPE